MSLRSRHNRALRLRLLQKMPLHSRMYGAILRLARNPWTRAVVFVAAWVILLVVLWGLIYLGAKGLYGFIQSAIR